MAFQEKELDRVGQQRAATRMRRDIRERRDRQENESWPGLSSGQGGLAVSSPVTEEINSNPRDAELLGKSREQVKKGEIHWGVEDEESSKSDAGG